VADAGLEPDALGLGGEPVVEVGGDVGGAPEDVDDVDRAGDVGDPAVDLAAEDLGGIGVVDGDGDDLDPGVVEVAGHVEGRLPRLALGLDPHHGHALGAPGDLVDPRAVLDQVLSPGVHGPQHGVAV
jgi:hypothetical protein